MEMNQKSSLWALSKRHGFALASLCSLALLSGCAKSPDAKPDASAALASAASASMLANNLGGQAGNVASQASSMTPKQDADRVAAMSADEKLRDELMQIVFADKYRQDQQFAIADMPNANERTQKESYRIEAVEHKQLADGRMILLTNSQMHDEDEQIVSGHANAGLLSLFVLTKNGNAWQVAQRYENMAGLGSNGTFGPVEWLALGSGKPGLAVHSPYTGQGQTVDGIALFYLGANKIQQLGSETIPLQSDNDGACLDETEKCWHVEGKYRFAAGDSPLGFDDLVLDFTGEETTLSARKGHARVKQALKGSARYRFDGKEFILLEGENLAHHY
jgi:hypothetical protein